MKGLIRRPSSLRLRSRVYGAVLLSWMGRLVVPAFAKVVDSRVRVIGEKRGSTVGVPGKVAESRALMGSLGDGTSSSVVVAWNSMELYPDALGCALAEVVPLSLRFRCWCPFGYRGSPAQPPIRCVII